MSRQLPFVSCINLAAYASLSGVAFRILPNGTIETDTAEEALKIRDAIARKRRKHTLRDSKRATEELSEATKAFLYALGVEGWDAGLTSDQISQAANIPKRSIPPIVRGLFKWAEHHGFNLNDYLIRTQKSVKGRPVSTYVFTEKGIDKFLPYLQKDGKKESKE